MDTEDISNSAMQNVHNVHPTTPHRRRRRSLPSESSPRAASTPRPSFGSNSSQTSSLNTSLLGHDASTTPSSTTPRRIHEYAVPLQSSTSYDSRLSPSKRTNPSVTTSLAAVARRGKNAVDKIARRIADSVDTSQPGPDDPLWIMGVCYPPLGAGSTPADPSSASGDGWPPAFYSDFTSTIWITYRSRLPVPIRDASLAELDMPSSSSSSHVAAQIKEVRERGDETKVIGKGKKVWPWAGEKTWSSDAGWGCMVRTGQSMLANALVHVRLGRDWRRPLHPTATASYAAYVQLLTWFFDTPARHAPFSVHRMTAAGKELGTDVGQWFGPAIAAGAIRTLVNAYTACGLGVAIAVDGVLYQSHVYAASHTDIANPGQNEAEEWGDRPVLVLIGVRLGIGAVHPTYYDTVKALFTFPQSVGIAGGRPSSSYYFVGYQGDRLFYLDPHNARPAVPLRHPPPPISDTRNPQSALGGSPQTHRRDGLSDSRSPGNRGGDVAKPDHPEGGPSDAHRMTRSDMEHASGTNVLSSAPRRGQASESPGTTPVIRNASSGTPSSSRSSSSSYAFSGTASDIHVNDKDDQRDVEGADEKDDADGDEVSVAETDTTCTTTIGWADEIRSPPPAYGQHRAHKLAGLSQSSPIASHSSSIPSTPARQPLNPTQLHYCNAYSAAEIATYHCTRVRTLGLSSLDPSMLLGFVCRDKEEWEGFKKRVSELPQPIFAIEKRPPEIHPDVGDDMSFEFSDEDEEPGEVGADDL